MQKEEIRFALIGHPLGHSFSAAYFREKFAREGLSSCSYHNLDLVDFHPEISQIKSGSLYRGFNVTVPYKQEIFRYLDDVTKEARAIGAVNVIRAEGRRWIGFNTDCAGFSRSLDAFLEEENPDVAPVSGLRALVLGNGGASQAVQYVLSKKSIPYILVTRNPSRRSSPNVFSPEKVLAYGELDRDCVRGSLLLVNTTSLGMYPVCDACPPIPYEAVGSRHRAFDLVYNPENTLFMEKCRQMGARVKNGLEMLHIQAEESWKIWMP